MFVYLVKKGHFYFLHQKLDAAISKIGSEPVHSPILLGCSILQYIYNDSEQSKSGAGDSGRMLRARHHGNLALQLGVFGVLLDILETEPFNGTSVCLIC